MRLMTLIQPFFLLPVEEEYNWLVLYQALFLYF